MCIWNGTRWCSKFNQVAKWARRRRTIAESSRPKNQTLHTKAPPPRNVGSSRLAQSCNNLVPHRPSCETKLPIFYSRKHKQFRKLTTRRPNPSFVNKGSLLVKVCLMSSSYLETILRWIRTTSKFVVYRSSGRAMSVHRWTVNRLPLIFRLWLNLHLLSSSTPLHWSFFFLKKKMNLHWSFNALYIPPHWSINVYEL